MKLQHPFGWLHNLQILPKVVILLSTFLVFVVIAVVSFFDRPFLHPYQYISSQEGYIVERECDISRGEWVRDAEAPYYSNMTCPLIQDHQNCIKYGRPDTGFLRWRWKPEGCELPRFDPARFLELMKGKSLAFIGDSLARNHMQSLMCLLSKPMYLLQVEYPKDISIDKDEQFKRMFYADYNFNISILWSPFLVRAEGPKEQTSNLWKLYLDEADEKWANRIEEFDYVIVSDGNWFTRPSVFYEKQQLVGCHYCQIANVTDLTLRYSHRTAFRTALRAIGESTNFNGVVFLRTLSPSHFENGEWNRGGNCVRREPFRSSEARLEGLELELYEAQVEEFRGAKRRAMGRGAEFRLLDTAGPMLLRPDGHPSRYGHLASENVTLYNDCVHWCLPGPIDVWNEFLLHMLTVL